jgi:hypothetical protein
MYIYRLFEAFGVRNAFHKLILILNKIGNEFKKMGVLNNLIFFQIIYSILFQIFI